MSGVEPWVEVRFGEGKQLKAVALTASGQVVRLSANEWNPDDPPKGDDKKPFFPIQVIIDTGTGKKVFYIEVTVDAFDDAGFPTAEPIVLDGFRPGEFTLGQGSGRSNKNPAPLPVPPAT